MISQLENRKWKVLSSKYIAQNGQWLQLRQEVVKLPN